jgi:DNA-binding CsgD family transcriptional regulator
VIRYIHFGKGEYYLILGLQRWGFLSILTLVHSAFFTLAFTGSKKLHRHERNFARLMGTFYLLYLILVVPSFILSGAFEALRAAFIFIFLSGHLIPTLFMNIYLGKYHSQESFVEKEFEAQLRDFCGKYGISKRETEVISLISKGYTNQQISDALYISLQTVKDHVHRIFVKSGVQNRVQLTNMIRADTP